MFTIYFEQSTTHILTRGAAQRAKIRTRAMVNKDLQNKQTNKTKIGPTTNDENGKKTTITLTEAKKKARNSATKSTNEVLVKDIYQNVSVFMRFDFFFHLNWIFQQRKKKCFHGFHRHWVHCAQNAVKLV